MAFLVLSCIHISLLVLQMDWIWGRTMVDSGSKLSLYIVWVNLDPDTEPMCCIPIWIQLKRWYLVLDSDPKYDIECISIIE